MSETEEDIASESAIEVIITPDPGFKLIFDGMRAHEELGRPFFIELDLSSGKQQDKLNKVVGASVTIWLWQSAEGRQERFFNGVATRIISHGMSEGAYRYRVELRPWLWLLKHKHDNRIFQKMKVFDIITKVFRDASFSDFEDKRQSSAGDTELEYCVQYNESCYDFVMRLMEKWGIYYYFKHEKTKHTMVLADDPNGHDKVTPAITYTTDQTEFASVDDHIWEWVMDLGLYSGKFTYQDYNFTTPSADLTSKAVANPDHKHDEFEVYEYPGKYENTGVGQKLSDVRIQAISANRVVAEGVSNARSLHAGWKFTLKDHPDSALNKEYTIIASDFSVSIAEGRSAATSDSETTDTYRVQFRAIPGDVPFRLERHTAWPRIRGPQTAKVVGKSGEEIETDQYGRIKVKFHWDRDDKVADEDRSCWIRVAQSLAGPSFGSIYIPRIGQEVVVEFLEGDPDQPIVTGVVYNATNTVPYSLPDNKTQLGLKTNSSKGGGGFNELRFEDKKDSEEIFMQAQKDYNWKVLNNETATIKKDTTKTVEEGNRSITVSKGNDTHKVETGNREATIKGNETVTVTSGNHKLDISAGKSEITAAQSIELKVGGNSIKIDTSGITINGIKIEASATATMKMSANATIDITATAPLTLQGALVNIN